MNKIKIKDLLKDDCSKIKNNFITNVWRFFSEASLEDIPKELRYEESDGSTYLVLSNGLVLGIYANSENFTLKYNFLEQKKIPIGSRKVSSSSYWKNKLGKRILNIDLIFGCLPEPYGLRFELEGEINIVLQYVSESEYTFDALVIR